MIFLLSVVKFTLLAFIITTAVIFYSSLVNFSLWIFGLFFFFSSRRRHTRYIGDWSSDVCSSDLIVARERPVVGDVDPRVGAACVDLARHDERRERADQITTLLRHDLPFGKDRSEERRVGKECRSGWARNY